MITDATKNIFGGAAVLSVLTLAWDKIKLLCHRVVSLAVVTATFRGDAKTMLSFYVMRKLKRSRFGDPTFAAAQKYVRPARRFLRLMFETVGEDPLMVYCGRTPIVVTDVTDKKDAVKVSFCRGTIKLDDFVKAVEGYYNEFAEGGSRDKKSRRFMVQRKYGTLGHMMVAHRSLGKSAADDEDLQSGRRGAANEFWMMGRLVSWHESEIGEGTVDTHKAMEMLAYPPEIDVLYENMVQWKASEDWYKERGIPWKIGMLLHGKPGTGKSAFVRASAIDMDMPVFILDIATMTNEEFVGAWELALTYAPVMVLIEDMDAVFRGRKRVDTMTGGLTFDCLLSRISGVENSDGVALFMTTNDLKSIDPAIGQVAEDATATTRPGRIDAIVEFKIMRPEERQRLAERIMRGMERQVITEMVWAGEDETGAQFQARCTKAALDFYWKKKQGVNDCGPAVPATVGSECE